MSSQLNCGAPHFRTLAKRLRNANYNYSKVIGEFLDYPVQKASRIQIKTEIDDTGRLQEISVADNIIDGFVGITEVGAANPFNMGHEKVGHDDDNETSEFGVGMKAAALSSGNLLKVITKVNSSCFYEAECDFLKMEKKQDVNDSYNPQIRIVSHDDYNRSHPFENGSTLTITKIRHEIFPLTTLQEITEKTKEIISNMYSYYIKKGLEIAVNGEIVSVPHNFFDENNCIPFTITKKVYILTNRTTGDIIVLASKKLEKLVWQIYDHSTRKYKRFDYNFNHYVEELLSKGYEWMYCPVSSDDKSCIHIDTTYTYFSKLFHGDENNDSKLPFNKCDIIKDGRKYGNVSFDKKNNGSKNYVAHRVEFKSKRIGKKLGMTFNKEINLELQNDLVYALKSAVNDSADKYSNSSKSDIKFDEACRKAISLKILDMNTCCMDMLSQQLIWEKHNEEMKSTYHKQVDVIKPKKKDEVFGESDVSESDIEEEIEIEIELGVKPEDPSNDIKSNEDAEVEYVDCEVQVEDEKKDEEILDDITHAQMADEYDTEEMVVQETQKIEDDESQKEMFESIRGLIINELGALNYSDESMQLLKDISMQVLLAK